MSRYLTILSVQRPFPVGTDSNDRAMWSCNYQAMAAEPVDKFEEEIGRVLFDAGLAVIGTNTTIGPAATIPANFSGDGPFMNIIDTGGFGPFENHDGGKYERMSFQIIVRAKNRQAARTRALAIWRVLDGNRNLEVTAA